MKRIIQRLSSFFCIVVILTGCASKDLKKFGGELALANQSGEPISTIVTLTVGGAIYGIGALVETQEEEKIFEPQKANIDTSEKNNVSEDSPMTYDTTLTVTEVVVDKKTLDTNTTLN